MQKRYPIVTRAVRRVGTVLDLPTSASSIHGILGAKIPNFGHDGWRWFWSQQHGDNLAWEVLRASRSQREDD